MFVQNSFFQQNQNIACYASRDGEFDCTPIIKQIWHAQKNCYLPALSATQECSLEFNRYLRNDSVRLNKYKILESENTEIILAEQLDIVLVPLVAFDSQGNRLGMGAGYYDRTFAFLLKKSVKKPFLLGVAFECQQHESLPSDVWDVPLDAILTEERLSFFKH